MPRFNTTMVDRTVTTNLAGGEAYSESAKLELISLVLTSFVQDQFYRSADKAIETLSELVGKVGPEFATKLALYARWEFGLRSVSHVMAANIAHQHHGYRGIRHFMAKIARRPDDLTEIVAFYIGKWGKPLPSCFRHGLRLGFDRFNLYQLGKYRQADKKVKLVDLVNLFHPKPGDRNQEALGLLVKDKLRSEDTWEARLTAAGSVEGDEAKAAAKAQVWQSLLAERQLGYFAGLRNARNIIDQAPDSIPVLCELLTDHEQIRKSLVLPFRFITALEAVAKDAGNRQVLEALIRALDISLENVPQLEGGTLVIVDVSGSMVQRDGKPAKMAGLFAAALWRKGRCEVVTFSARAVVPVLLPGDSLFSLANSIFACQPNQGTDLRCVFEWMQKPYDRIIVLSDMQAWVGHDVPKDVFNGYKQRTGANPVVFSWDLSGYGSLQFLERQVYALAGFSDKVFDLMKLLEQDREALIHTVEAYQGPQWVRGDADIREPSNDSEI